MKHRLLYILAAFMPFILLSCSTEELSVSHWGKTEYFEDFLYKKCPPLKMEKDLVVAANEDAVSLAKPIKLVLCKESDGKFINVDKSEICLFVNNKEQEKNVIEILPTKEEQKIHIELILQNSFVKASEADNFKYYFRLEDNPGLDYINNVKVATCKSLVLSNDEWTPMDIYVDRVSNSLKVFVVTGLIVIAAFLVLWLILSRLIFFPATRFGRVTITYNNGIESVLKTNGAYQLVLTNNPRLKDSLLHRIFVGKRIYEVNDFWERTMVMKSYSMGRRISIRPIRGYDVEGEMLRKEAFKLVNENNEKVTIETN
jgi:hypothetical protein